MKTALSIILGALLGGGAWAQQAMTVKTFEELVAAPRDKIALRPELSGLPFWRESRCSYTIKYQDGKQVRGKYSQTAKTVSGKFIVFVTKWDDLNTITYSIIGYDERASAIRHWGIVDGTLGEGTINLDTNRKVYASTSSIAEGRMQISVGAFSDKELSLRTQNFRDGVLFSTWEWNEQAVEETNKP